MASIISSMVMTFVTLAGGSGSWAFFSYRIVPVATSISSALFACTSSPSALTPHTSVLSSNSMLSTTQSFFIRIPSMAISLQLMRRVKGYANKPITKLV